MWSFWQHVCALMTQSTEVRSHIRKKRDIPGRWNSREDQTQDLKEVTDPIEPRTHNQDTLHPRYRESPMQKMHISARGTGRVDHRVLHHNGSWQIPATTMKCVSTMSFHVVVRGVAKHTRITEPHNCTNWYTWDVDCKRVHAPFVVPCFGTHRERCALDWVLHRTRMRDTTRNEGTHLIVQLTALCCP